jgi:hypothetical protein
MRHAAGRPCLPGCTASREITTDVATIDTGGEVGMRACTVTTTVDGAVLTKLSGGTGTLGV